MLIDWGQDQVTYFVEDGSAFPRCLKGGEFLDCDLVKVSILYSWLSRYMSVASRKQALDT